jgi:hypothetical protein
MGSFYWLNGQGKLVRLCQKVAWKIKHKHQQCLKKFISADDLKKYKNISITASNDYGSYN